MENCAYLRTNSGCAPALMSFLERIEKATLSIDR